MPNLSDLAERFRRDSREATTKLASAAAAAGAPPNPLGLRFPPGARVLDAVTGKRGAVTSGWRDPRTQGQVFLVALDDGAPAYRTDRELEPETVTPAVQP